MRTPSQPDRTISRTRLVAWWLACSAIGAVLVARPDQDNRVFSLTEGHGPAPLDLLGSGLLLVGWLPSAWYLVTHRPTRCPATWAGLVLLAVAGPALVVAIATDAATWTWLGAALALLIAQLFLLAGTPPQPAQP